MELMRLRCVKDLRIFVKIYINFQLIFQKVLLNLFLVILINEYYRKEKIIKSIFI